MHITATVTVTVTIATGTAAIAPTWRESIGADRLEKRLDYTEN